MRWSIDGPIVLAVLAMVVTAQVKADPYIECSVLNRSQVETRDCLVEVEKNASAALATIFGYTMDAAKELDKVTAPRKDSVPALKAGQDGWAQYRDKHCDYVGTTWGGGSGTGIAILSCRIDLARARSDELMEFVQLEVWRSLVALAARIAGLQDRRRCRRSRTESRRPSGPNAGTRPAKTYLLYACARLGSPGRASRSRGGRLT